MNVMKVFLLFSCMIYQTAKILAYETNTDISICTNDLTEFCGMDQYSPYSVQSISDSRACLRKNRDSISKHCLNYLELDKPSIIESCFTEMKTYCNKVIPGGFRIHSCLSAVSVGDLSPSCQEALAYDQEIIQPRGETENLPNAFVSVWSRWVGYFVQISELIAMQMRLSRGNLSPNLRGFRIIGIQGNDDERVIFLSDDDNIGPLDQPGNVDDSTDDGDDDYDTKANRIIGESAETQQPQVVTNP